MTQERTDEDVVRAGIALAFLDTDPRIQPALAALDRLVAQNEELEELVHRLDTNLNFGDLYAEEVERADRAEERIEKLQGSLERIRSNLDPSVDRSAIGNVIDVADSWGEAEDALAAPLPEEPEGAEK